MDNKTCWDCKYFNTLNWVTCTLDGSLTVHFKKACDKFVSSERPVTNSERVRKMSDEELAELLVSEYVVIKNIQINDSCSANTDCSYMKMWKSALLPTKVFDDKEKAFEATIEELKKEVKDE